ncbi:MAG: sulfotransferase domain-containing protein [Saprospiraceae bacterium]|nr:sulfotransferase domain-containing protein [Saprospiraceae bacterium]
MKDFIKFRDVKGGQDLFMARPVSDNKVKSFFIFSGVKSGSTLLNNLIQLYTNQVNLPVLNIPGFIFEQGIPLPNARLADSSVFTRQGYGYIGWRSYWEDLPDLNNDHYNHVVLVRDPRDRLVSLYFAIAYSHSKSKKGVLKDQLLSNRKNALQSVDDVNDWVFREPKFIPAIINSYRYFLNRLSSHSTRIYRYEDVIFRKLEWMVDMVEFLGLPFRKDIINEVVEKMDVSVSGERKDQHIRQVNPGNHLKHFTPETIAYLDSQFDDILKTYDYLNMESNHSNDICFGREGKNQHLLYA